MDILYWSDYACPYCYIAITNLRKAAQELGIKDLNIKMKAFELDPNAPTESLNNNVERFAEKYNISFDEAKKRIDSITKMASDSELDFDYSKVKYTNTLNAHRLTKLAEKIGRDNELAEELYKAYFIDNKELANPDTLIEAGVSVGLKEEEIIDLINSDFLTKEVRLDETIAHDNGIQAVPFLLIDQEYIIPGALPVESYKEILNEMNSNQ